MPLTQDRLKEVLDYDPQTGVFVWRVSKKGILAGTVAGHRQKRGYVRIVIDRKGYYAHRLAWLYVRGSFPENQIDHRDCSKGNNVIENLRDADRCQNAHNVPNIMGVSFHKKAKKWHARITSYGKSIYLGIFSTIEEALEVRNKAAIKYHKEFARTI